MSNTNTEAKDINGKPVEKGNLVWAWIEGQEDNHKELSQFIGLDSEIPPYKYRCSKYKDMDGTDLYQFIELYEPNAKVQ